MWLRQSTASQEVLLGPFLDSTDGNTAETGLTIANTDIKLWKEGATTEANKNSGGATHIASGRYYAVLDATDTATLGKLEVNVHVAGALAVRREFMVVPAMVYDSMILGTDTLDANVTQWLGTAAATPTTAGVPEVDVTHLGGAAQSATDLKDFADAGYDPATNKVQGVVLVDTTTTNTDMRGTDGANTTVPDAAGTAATPAEVATALSTYDGPTNAEMVAAFTEIKGATWAAGTDTLEHIRNKQTDIETDTQALQTQIGTAGAGLTDLGGMSTGMKAEVNAEAADVLKTDTISEMAQGAPTATPTFEEAVMYLYMALRNKVDVTATTKEFHNDAGTVIWKKALSDDGTTYSEAEGVSGP